MLGLIEAMLNRRDNEIGVKSSNAQSLGQLKHLLAAREAEDGAFKLAHHYSGKSVLFFRKSVAQCRNVQRIAGFGRARENSWRLQCFGDEPPKIMATCQIAQSMLEPRGVRGIHSTKAARAAAIFNRQCVRSIERNRHVRYLTAIVSDASKKSVACTKQCPASLITRYPGVGRYRSCHPSRLFRIVH